ncbi:MAG TPA: hypothetical protein VGP62_13225 [Bryobacteraceae bacterium]|nr:hypothetical protein [Bryobacteraceae bacterium]
MMGRIYINTTHMKEVTKELATDLGNVRALSDKTNEEQDAVQPLPAFAAVKDELCRIYDDVRDRLAEKLKPLGIQMVQFTVHSLIPADVRGLAEKLARIVPEVKVGTTEDTNGVPSWLLGNLCD